jgi:hypothetical protein
VNSGRARGVVRAARGAEATGLISAALTHGWDVVAEAPTARPGISIVAGRPQLVGTAGRFHLLGHCPIDRFVELVVVGWGFADLLQ